ncbi:DoxX family protein [Flavobacteriaceae bacterium]|nr:DoxX family protein [Flavobacteriaceae bacterium]
MEEVKIALKIIVGLSLLNVWLLQYNKPSRWRGGDAKTMLQEFDVYGLGSTMCYVVGFLKVGFSLALIASIWLADLELVVDLELVAASALGLLLTGSILMHIKIKDALIKSFPAALFLLFCLAIIGL